MDQEGPVISNIKEVGEMPAFVKRWIVNWATSLLGASAGGTMILAGFAADPDDYAKIAEGVLLLLMGLFAKDSSVTGGVDRQE